MKNVVLDKWISKQLTYNAYALIVDDKLIEKIKVSSSEEYKWLKSIQSQKVFVFTKINPDNLKFVRFVESLKFNLVDTNMTFCKELVFSDREKLIDGDYSIGFADEQDKDATSLVARNNFIYSRFHVDSFFEKELADNIKANWVENFFLGQRGDFMIVAKKNKEVIAFLQLLIKNDELYIDLIAVDKKHRKQGLAKAMINYVTNYFNDKKKIYVGTQIVNLPSINLYQKLGFQFISGQYVFHYHN